jgi:hypothetical protein
MLANAPEYASITIYQVDFDGQKDVVRSFGATHQSTLIAFHGARRWGAASVTRASRGSAACLRAA